MKLIIKGNEPEAWKIYKNTEGVAFTAIPELKNALLKEQGYLCCYCMSRISFNKMKVEHWKPRRYKTLKLHYGNLFAACLGNFCEGNHCDTLKDEDEITINPTDIKNNCESIIGYKLSDGSLTYPPQYEHDIKNILNLNNSVLKLNRIKALDGVTEALGLKKYSKSECQKQLKKFQELNSDGKFQPYCMIGIRFLERKLRQMS